MNAICILWILLHTVDTSPGILRTPFYYECNMHTMDTSPYCGHLSRHTKDTFLLWMQYAYYGYFSILWTPLHYEHNMHAIDTSAFFRHILWTPLHTSHYYITLLCINYGHPCIPRKPMHNMDPSAYYRHLCILQSTPTHTCTMDTYA